MVAKTETAVALTIDELRNYRKQWFLETKSDKGFGIGFVPTMGALHKGHMALIEAARSQCSYVIVSIFVNPLQFGPNEDFAKYPRTFEKDLELCREAGVDLIFHPAAAEIYPRGNKVTTKVVPPEPLVSRLCGAFRPGHFMGVATVVTKLFNLVQPEVAYFGEKDYQQLVVIRRIVSELNMPVTVVGVPTVRETDGLALSSRNLFLSKEHRSLAPKLFQTLTCIKGETLADKMPLDEAIARGRRTLEKIKGVQLQYLEVCDPDTLEPLNEAKVPMVILVAAKVGEVRLIDNIIVRE